MIEIVLALVQSPLIWAPALTALLTLSGVAVRVGLTTNRKGQP